MQRLTRPINLTTCLLVAIIAIQLGYQAGGARNGMLAGTRIGTVNLSGVLDGLDQRGDAEAGLKAKTEGIIAEQERRESAIAGKQTAFEAATDDAVKQRLEEEIALLTLRYQAWTQFIRDQIDVERALLLQDLYRSVTNAIEDLAETEGFDLVVVNDSQGQIEWNPDSQLTREAQTLQQIRGRRILYGAQAIDLTDDLVARMNNTYRTGN